MEREVIVTGIGGQGVQLVAKVLAGAAAATGRHVMLFGVYGGMMRGGPSESTVVIAKAPIETPPIVPSCWAVLAMHPSGLDEVAPRLRPGGLFFANHTLVPRCPRTDVDEAGIAATALAEKAGAPMAAGMIALGAFVTHTGLVPLDAVVTAMRAALPPHRRALADVNAAMLALGAHRT